MMITRRNLLAGAGAVAVAAAAPSIPLAPPPVAREVGTLAGVITKGGDQCLVGIWNGVEWLGLQGDQLREFLAGKPFTLGVLEGIDHGWRPTGYDTESPVEQAIKLSRAAS